MFNESIIQERHLELLYSKPFFEIEMTNECNMNCIYCPRGRMSRPVGSMDRISISKIVDNIPSDSKIMIAGMGEPLLNPLTFDMISILKEKENVCGVTTNGTKLNKKNLLTLMSLDIDLIQVSIPIMRDLTVTDKVISSLMRTFEDVDDNLETVQISVVKGGNVPDISDKLVGFQGMNIVDKPLHSRAGKLYSSLIDDVKVCGMFPKITFITWQGDILSCCHDIEGKHLMGNLITDGLNVCINRKEEIIRKGDLFEICSECDDVFRQKLFKDASMLE